MAKSTKSDKSNRSRRITFLGKKEKNLVGKKILSKEKMIIVVDSREQNPFSYQVSIRKKLNTGDYSIVGLEERITIERKTKVDLFSTCGQGRKRFIHELERMRYFDYAAIIVEASLSRLLTAPKHSRMKPSSVINSLLAWSIRYNVHIFFASNRKLAELLTYRLLEKFWKSKKKV